MIGKRVSHFEIVEELGAGGMGVVYRARDLNLDRDVALKFLPAHLSAHDTARQRFVQEARAASRLDHENICTIHEIGDTEDGATFIAMSHYGGETLRSRLERGPLEVEKAVAIAAQIAAGLEAAHAEGIVHRDVKPDNVIVTDRGQVKILDFGVARLADATRLTSEGVTLGTLAYMSPEQLQGGEVDARADIWALGVVLYEMLTGRLPFRGESGPALAYAVVHEDPLPVETHRPDVPEALRSVIGRALRKDLGQRYASAGEMRAALQALAGAPGERSAMRPSAAVLVLGLLIVAVVVAALVVRQRRHAARMEWARNTALPEIERLVEETSTQGGGPGLWRAFDLAAEVETVMPGEPLLERLWGRCARTIHFRSTPEGGRVYAKPYVELEGPWRYLGDTPLDIRFPRGYSRLRIEKEGFASAYEVIWNGRWLVDTVSVTLQKEAETPTGMVWIEASEDEPLMLPGLERIEAERVPGFWVDRFEVSNADYKRFVEAGGYRERRHWKHPFLENGRTLTWEEAMSRFQDRTGRPGPATWEVGDYPEGTGDYPVGGVSWYEAAAYAEFAGKALPTVFHWSAAAFTWGAPAVLRLANLTGDGPWPVQREGSMHRSGAINLGGNVREWCWNEINREDERLILGGGWSDPPYAFNDAYAQPMFDRSAINGFRCIQYAAIPPSDDPLQRAIELPFRDFTKERPVGDEEYAYLLTRFAYDKTDLDPRIEEEHDEGDWVRQAVSFDAAYGDERVLAYLWLPKTTLPPYQTLIHFPGSGAIHQRVSEPNIFMDRVDFFVKSGRALMLPIYKGTYERGGELTTDQPDETVAYRDYVVMWAQDLARSIDYLESRDDIDTDKLAYWGTSWGGRMGPLMLAVEKRLAVGMLYVAGLKFQRALPEADPFNFVTRVTQPILMVGARHDFFFPMESSQRPLFELLGTPAEHKRWVVYEGGHAVPRNKLIQETLGWLDRYLGEVE